MLVRGRSKTPPCGDESDHALSAGAPALGVPPLPSGCSGGDTARARPGEACSSGRLCPSTPEARTCSAPTANTRKGTFLSVADENVPSFTYRNFGRFGSQDQYSLVLLAPGIGFTQLRKVSLNSSSKSGATSVGVPRFPSHMMPPQPPSLETQPSTVPS